MKRNGKDENIIHRDEPGTVKVDLRKYTMRNRNTFIRRLYFIVPSQHHHSLSEKEMSPR